MLEVLRWGISDFLMTMERVIVRRKCNPLWFLLYSLGREFVVRGKVTYDSKQSHPQFLLSPLKDGL